MRWAIRANIDAGKLHIAVDGGNARALRRVGAYAWRTARNSIRKSKKKSKSGTPPHTRKGQLKRAIRFTSDTRSAIIGPSVNDIGLLGKLHEFGGIQIRPKARYESATGKWRVLKGKRKVYRIGAGGPIRISGSGPVFCRLKTQAQVDRATWLDANYWFDGGTEAAVYPARPFMQPALEKTLPHVEQFWKDSIR